MHSPKSTLTFTYWDFWGKASPSANSGPAWHPLVFHSIDVSCVVQAYLQANPTVLASILEITGWGRDEALRTLGFLAACHDLGKFHFSFQAKAPELYALLFPGLSMAGAEAQHHARAGLGTLADWFKAKLTDREWEDVELQLEPVLNSACGHHGRPEALRDATKVSPGAMPSVRAYLTALEDIFGSQVPARLAALPEAQARKLSSVLAGVFTLCDWVGSSQTFFPYEKCDADLRSYRDKKLSIADAAIDKLGLFEKKPSVRAGFEYLFPAYAGSPSPLQAYADNVELPPAGEPGLFILEDETGSGKTEAALTLASRLVASGAGRGILYSLPTQTTANALFLRMSATAPAFFEEDQNPSLVLAHGGASLALQRMVGSTLDPASISADLAPWARDSSKTSLLADFGVCTIDQVVMSALPVKHFALRQLGLHRKVLVVDEAHACEPYLLELLARAIEIHAMNGGSTILLSATLPRAAKLKLVHAFNRGSGLTPARLSSDAYPLATKVFSKGAFESTVASRAAPKFIALEPLDESDLQRVVSQWLNADKCVAIIRNTVRSAQETFELFNELFPGRCQLVHARFAMRHRAENDERLLGQFGKADPTRRGGQLVVATQVVEQSLDVDFDEMVVDLAPMDALLQRLGRRRRHRRGAHGCLLGHPDAFDTRTPGPVFVVMPPVDGNEKFLQQLPPYTDFVYPLPGVLWRTGKFIHEKRGLEVPTQVRQAVEYSYSDDEGLPSFLMRDQLKSEGKAQAARQSARFVALDPWLGYSALLDAISSESCVTRLGEPSYSVALVSAKGQPLFGSLEESKLSIRKSLLQLVVAEDGYARLFMNAAIGATWVSEALDHKGRTRTVTYSREIGLEIL